MAKFNENQKLLILAGVTVLLCGAGGAGVWWAQGLVQEKTDQIATMHNDIKALETKIAKIPNVESDVIVLRENLHEYVKILPDEDELNDFLRITNQFVDQSGVHLYNFLPGPPSRSGKSAFERYSYKFSLDATLWQFLHFTSLFERYQRFVKIVDFSLSAGQTNPARAGGKDVVHKITVNVETYRYRASKDHADVPIPNYANKVAKLREAIFQNRQEIGIEGYEFPGARGRRDIFVDPREAKGPAGANRGGLTPRDQKRIMQTVIQQIGKSEELLRQMQNPDKTIFARARIEKELRESLSTIGQRVDEINEKGQISHAPLKSMWSREVLDRLGRLRQAVDVNPTDSRLATADQLKQTIEGMKSDLNTGLLRDAIGRYEQLGDALKIPETDPRYALYVDIEGLYLRAKLATEFSGLSLEISGVCVNDVGKSGVILNGTVFEEGDYIDNNLLLKAVARDRVEFVYKGFTVVKML